MNKILTELDYYKVFLNDILIHLKNVGEHKRHLKEVFQGMYSNNISINKDKSAFREKCNI